MTLNLDPKIGGFTLDRKMNDWLERNKSLINSALDESFAARDRGETYSPEEAEAILTQRRAARSSHTE